MFFLQREKHKKRQVKRLVLEMNIKIMMMMMMMMMMGVVVVCIALSNSKAFLWSRPPAFSMALWSSGVMPVMPHLTLFWEQGQYKIENTLGIQHPWDAALKPACCNCCRFSFQTKRAILITWNKRSTPKTNSSPLKNGHPKPREISSSHPSIVRGCSFQAGCLPSLPSHQAAEPENEAKELLLRSHPDWTIKAWKPFQGILRDSYGNTMGSLP